ncbi:hypothetical protein NQ318_000597 [Aromia moschata]|uniref:Uncharacterized protein n=1 Tax=Aromia moschata TaxID=1265417 RepID=A0AAV8XSS3_9CUCU|nr:hypothetical protein NQ318_000597 [Aromia moschata]
MFSISKLIVIMCLYNGLAAVDYLQCTENMPKSPETKKRTVRNRLLTALSILNFVQWGIPYSVGFNAPKALCCDLNGSPSTPQKATPCRNLNSQEFDGLRRTLSIVINKNNQRDSFHSMSFLSCWFSPRANDNFVVYNMFS